MLILFGTPVATDSEVLHYKMILINNVSAILEREYEIVYAIKIINYKGGGTGEILKLKLHLNSEVYKRGNFHDFG